MSFPRPKGFRPSDLVVEAEFCDPPPFVVGGRNPSAVARKGLSYERRVHQHFQSAFRPRPGGLLYVPSRWIRFQTSDPRERELRYAEPDGLFVDFSRLQITIVEVKLTHTQYAWWGLRRLYEPLIRKIFGPRWRYSVCEVCRFYDPGVAWPEPFTLVRSLTDLHANEFGVMPLSSFGMVREEGIRSAALLEFPVGLQGVPS